jgi:perosamine synthetase
MRIGRTLAPAAAPITWQDFVSGLKGWVKGQSELKRFENEVNTFFGVSNSFFLSSGKAALTISLKALKNIYPDRDEVLIPAYTCYSVPSAVVRAGLKVKLCDLDPDTLDFNYAQLGCALANKRLLCVIPGHLFGGAVDIDRLKTMAADLHVPILEDAAQSFGGQCGEKKLGTLGDVGIFSLGRGKALSTVEGGIIVTRRDDIARLIERHFSELPKYGFRDCIKLAVYAVALMCLLHPALFWIPKMLPFLRMGETIYDPEFEIKQMSPLQAGLSRNWQQRVERFQQARHRTAQEWLTLLQTLQQKNFIQGNGEIPDLIRFPWKIDSLNVRKRLMDASDHMGLGITKTYPDAIDGIPELTNKFAGQQYPVAKELTETVLTLPIHSMLKPQDIEKIKRIISDVVRDEGKNKND